MNERSKHGLPIGLFKVICAVSVFAMIAVVGCGTGKVCAKPTRKSTEKMVPQAAGTEIRTESEVMSRGGRQEQESDTVKKLVQRESDIKARLVPAETEVASLKKEIDRLVTARMHVVDVLDENAVKRVEEDNRRAADRVHEKLRRLEKDVAAWKEECAALQESITWIRAIDRTYHGSVNANDEISAEERRNVKSELDHVVMRIVARHSKVESLKDEIPAPELLKVKQLDEIVVAGSLTDALRKAREIDSVYGGILDKFIENRISRLEHRLDSAPEHSRWHSTLRALKEMVPIDPENKRLKKAIADAVGHVSPAMTVTAELDGVVVPDVQFFANGKPVSSPYHHVFKTGNRSLSGDLRFLDAVYFKDGVAYAARRYGASHNWFGETNIVLKLAPTPKAGTVVRLKLGRLPQSVRNLVGKERNVLQEASIDLAWCPPGTDTVKFVSPDSNTESSVVRTVSVGFWIARYELTGHQYHAIVDEGKSLFRAPWSRRHDKQPTDDTPILASYVDLIRAFSIERRIPVSTYGGPIFSDNAVLDIPGVDQWVHAARFGGFTVSENDFGDYAWFMENSKTNAFFKGGQKKPNSLGLYDVYGNVAEWVDGSADVWLGLYKPDPDYDNDLISQMGGGRNDDFESSTEILQKHRHARSSEGQGKAGVRLMGRSVFEHEKSLLDWVRVCDLLDSENEEEYKSGMALLAELATESDDEVLRKEAARDFVARGGAPQDVGLKLTSEVKRLLIRRTSNVEELAKYVLEDDDARVREVAFRKLEKIGKPSKKVASRYLVGISDDQEAFRVLFECFIRNRGTREVPQEGVDEELFSFLVLKAANARVRAKALCGVSNPQVLKKVALTDVDVHSVCGAIDRIKDRAILMEILKQTKTRNVKIAVRDRLEKLSE